MPNKVIENEKETKARNYAWVQSLEKAAKLCRSNGHEGDAQVLEDIIQHLSPIKVLTAKERGDLWDRSGKNPAGDWRDVIHTRDEEELHQFFDSQNVPRTVPVT